MAAALIKVVALRLSTTSTRQIILQRSLSNLSIAGVYPPITTPFNQDESIAWDQLKTNLSKWNQIDNLRGYLVQGSNGEYCYLTPQERVEMIEKVCQWSGKDKLVLAGSGMESTKATIEMTNAMAKAGAHAAVVITPCYFKGRMTSEALIQHFTSVADQSTIPVILYSVPANTTLDLPIDVVTKLSAHPNIIGIKDSGGDISKIAQMVHETKHQKNFQVLAGSASFLLAALQVGACGGICALANALPKEVCTLQSLFEQSKIKEAVDLQHRLVKPNMIVTRGLGVPALKKAMDWLGLYGGPVRKPLLPLNEQEEERVKKSFSDEGFLR